MRSAFVRQMTVTTLTLLMTLLALGGILHLAFTTYLGRQQEKELTQSAAAAAALTEAYGGPMEISHNWDFYMGLHLAARMSECDVLVCDESGIIRACACEDLFCEHLLRLSVDPSLAQSGVCFVGRLPGLYEEQRRICLAAVEDGFVIVSSPIRSVRAATGALSTVFFCAALLVWLAAVAATWYLCRREARPLREMARSVHRFAHGDMSIRVRQDKGLTREMGELVAAFNNMADCLEREERLRRDFVANVSHELKTPMTSIAGYLDGMLDGTIAPEDCEKYMRVVSDEVRRMSRLVRSMLEISRMQSEGLDESKLSRFDAAEAAAQILVSFEQRIREKNIEVDLQLPEKALYTVAHRDGITQVIYNLVENAVKFCEEGGTLGLSLEEKGGKLLLSVSNTGATIPEEELPLIFDRFHKLDKSRSKDPDGVGLGLYIVKTILGAHGENIRVESHSGKTSFTFTLPAAK